MDGFQVGSEILEMAAEYPIMVVVRSSVAQLVERTAVNRIVAGSSPARGAASVAQGVKRP